MLHGWRRVDDGLFAAVMKGGDQARYHLVEGRALAQRQRLGLDRLATGRRTGRRASWRCAILCRGNASG